jgi:hypothetical protein
MYTAGLVVRLTTDRRVANEVLDQLQAAGPFALGQEQGHMIPLAMAVSSPRDARHWHDWVAKIPGVRDLEVVYVHWDEQEQKEFQYEAPTQSA